MGRKVNPVGFRLGIVSDWDSKWFAERNYTEQLHEDLAIREMIMKELTRAGISRIELERSANKVDVTLHTSKPGIVIGKQGANVERIRQQLEKKSGMELEAGRARLDSLRLFVHGIGAWPAPPVQSQSEVYALLAEWGLPTSPYFRTADDIDGVLDFVTHYGEHRHDVEHEIDGVVVKVDELALHDELL